MQTINLDVVENSHAVPMESEQALVVEAVSPTVSVERVDGGVQIIVHDLRGDHVAALYDGQTGEQGEQGLPGNDGYTPVKGVDYFDGQDGKDGQDGAPGQTGADGFSPVATVAKSGSMATITITDATGTTTATVSDGAQGSPGPKGDPGDDYVLTPPTRPRSRRLCWPNCRLPRGCRFEQVHS